MDDNQWIEDLYCRYYKFLVVIGSHYLQGRSVQTSDLEDCIQTVFLQMVRKRKKLETHPNLEGWLIVALRKELSSRIKKERKCKKGIVFSIDDEKQEGLIQNVIADSLHDPESLYADADQEKLEAVEKLIGKENADLLMQRYVYNVSLSKLAQQKHISEAALKMRIFRMKEKIHYHSEIF